MATEKRDAAADMNNPRARVHAAMVEIGRLCERLGVRIVTRVGIQRSEGGDQAIVDSEWAVAAVKDWPPEPEEPA